MTNDPTFLPHTLLSALSLLSYFPQIMPSIKHGVDTYHHDPMLKYEATNANPSQAITYAIIGILYVSKM